MPPEQADDDNVAELREFLIDLRCTWFNNLVLQLDLRYDLKKLTKEVIDELGLALYDDSGKFPENFRG